MTVLTFRCQCCGKTLHAGSEFVGRRAKCPKCGEPFVIKGDVSQTREASTSAPPSHSTEEAPLVRASEQGLHLTFTWPVVLTALGGCAVSAVAITLIAMMVSAQSPSPMRPPPTAPIAEVPPHSAAEDDDITSIPVDRSATAKVDRAGLIESISQSVARLETDSGSIGTGFLLLQNDLVVTNFHVIDDATSVTATFKNGEKIAVEGWVAVAAQHDLAVLQLAQPAAAEPLTLSTDDPRVGADVFAVGMPKGLSFSASKGIIASYRSWAEVSQLLTAEGANPEQLPKADSTRWIQSDVSISPGNSGGPLLSSDGQVLGVNTLSSTGARSQNLNFAVHQQHVAELMERRMPIASALARLPERRPAPQRRVQDPPPDKKAEERRLSFAIDVFAWDNAAEAVGDFCLDVFPAIGNLWAPTTYSRIPQFVDSGKMQIVARSAVSALEKLHHLNADALPQPMMGYQTSLIVGFEAIRDEATAASRHPGMVDGTKALAALRTLHTHIVTHSSATQSRLEWNHAEFDDADGAFRRASGISEDSIPKWRKLRGKSDISQAILSFCDGPTAPTGERADIALLWDTFSRERWMDRGEKTLGTIRYLFPNTPDGRKAAELERELEKEEEQKARKEPRR